MDFSIDEEFMTKMTNTLWKNTGGEIDHARARSIIAEILDEMTYTTKFSKLFGTDYDNQMDVVVKSYRNQIVLITIDGINESHLRGFDQYLCQHGIWSYAEKPHGIIDLGNDLLFAPSSRTYFFAGDRCSVKIPTAVGNRIKVEYRLFAPLEHMGFTDGKYILTVGTKKYIVGLNDYKLDERFDRSHTITINESVFQSGITSGNGSGYTLGYISGYLGGQDIGLASIISESQIEKARIEEKERLERESDDDEDMDMDFFDDDDDDE